MTAVFLSENFPGFADLVRLLDGEGYSPSAIMTEIVRRLEASRVA